MHRPLTLALTLAIAGSTARGDSPPKIGELTERAWTITDTVLARHVEPPTRQQMILAGFRALERSGLVPPASGLARRVSDVIRPDQLAPLLAESWTTAARSESFDREKLEAAFLEGLLSAVPGEARLMSSKERKVDEAFQANLYVGIQVALGLDDKARRPVFREILEGGPADHAGVKAGDLIESVDGVPVEGMPLAQVVDRLRGEEGTDVLVRCRRPGTDEDFTRTMTRGRLPRASIQGLSPLPGKRWSVRLDGPPPIGYLKLTEVSGSTPQELRVFAEQLEAEGARALVLDLRKVSEARFHPTVLLADALLDSGTIGRVRSADGEKTYRAEPDALFRGWPIAVLADGPTSPEMAWLCDALRDNHRASIVGNPSVLRDPVVPETVALPGGEWSVELTTGRLERGDGKPLTGFDPNRPASEGPSMGEKRHATTGPPATARVAPPRPKPPAQDPLVKAREILADALKSAGK
jgi:carboxyl-terminal processing protease